MAEADVCTAAIGPHPGRYRVSRDPSGAVRRLLDSTERALAGVGGASGGREAVAGVVSRFLSDLQPPAPGRGGEGIAKPPGGGPAEPSAGARQGGVWQSGAATRMSAAHIEPWLETGALPGVCPASGRENPPATG